jgi:hypothetical protein
LAVAILLPTISNTIGITTLSLKKRERQGWGSRAGDVHTHNSNDPLANSIQTPDKVGTVQDKDQVQKMQDTHGAAVDYQSDVGAPNGDVVQFTPNPNAPDGLGDTKVVKKDVAPDPNPPQDQRPKKEEPK